jgi:hypothetical protein
MEDYHYKAILNNIFRCLHSTPLKSLNQLAQEKILINICMEMNNRSFLFIYDCIKNNTKDNLKDIIMKIISDLESVVSEQDIKNKCDINIKKIIVLEQKELIHLSQLLIVYGLLLAEKKLIYIQTVKTCFNYTLRKNIYLIVNYYIKPEIKTLNLSEEDDEDEEELEEEDFDDINMIETNKEENITKNKLDPKYIKKKKEIMEIKMMEKEIEAKANDLTYKKGGINAKIKQKNALIENNINKLQKLKLTKAKENTFEIKALKKPEDKNKKKISMNLIKEKEKAIETLEHKISNIQNEYQNYKTKKEKEIKDMKNRVSLLLDKVNILEKKKVLLKDYNELKEKSNKYDDLIVKYKRLKKIVDEKWDLTEQQYLDIIAKKDEDILRLKEALILSERQSMMNGNLTMKMNNNFGNSLFNDYDSVGENSINLTEYGYGGFGNGMNNNYNSFFKNKNNAMNSNNNLLMSPNMSDINLKDVNNLKDDEDKK